MSRGRATADGLRLALGTLTVVPVRPPRSVDRDVAGRAMTLAAVVSLVPAGALWVVARAGVLVGAPPLLVAAGALGALALVSHGLHLDGLADTADALGSGPDRERALTIMRSGDVGPMGAATLTLTLLGQAAALAALVVLPHGAALAGIGVAISRGALPMACAARVPAARPDGLGAAVAGSVPTSRAVLTVLLLGAAASCGTALAGRPWWLGALATAATTAAAALVVRRCVRAFGGITGDVLGAVVELGQLAAWALLAVLA